MADTLGSTAAAVTKWLRGSRVDASMVNDAINDAIDAEFKALIRASLSVLMGGPTNITLAAAAERATIVSIADPTVSVAVSDVAADDPTLVAHTVRATYTYVTDSGTETLAAPATTHTTAMGFVASVHAPPIVYGAIGWNCYASNFAGTGTLVKQNDAPIAFNTVFDESDIGFTHEPDDPEEPTENTTGDNIFYIRHMEVVTTNNLLKSWNNADIDSDLMRRAGMSIAASTEYQTYAYDLINQRQLEVRPALGSTLTARYFFIVKPRRLAFDNSPMPFPTVPDDKYIRCQALSDLFLSLREYKTSESWQAKATEELASCVLAVASMNRPKNQRIMPYRT